MNRRSIVIGLMALALGCSHTHTTTEKEGSEIKMTFDQIPVAAQQGLMKAAGGAPVTTVDKESRDGKTVYEADVKSGGKNWEIIVDENGNLISKKVDEEEGESRK